STPSPSCRPRPSTTTSTRTAPPSTRPSAPRRRSWISSPPASARRCPLSRERALAARLAARYPASCGWGRRARSTTCGAEVSTFSLRFGTPAHGWLEATLAGPEGESTVIASDVPGDSLRMLADAARAVLDGHDGEVTWFLEPAEEHWRFA